LLINGKIIGQSAIDFFLISFPEICINSGPRLHISEVINQAIFYHVKGAFFPPKRRFGIATVSNKSNYTFVNRFL
jgi:hypothetical protein